MTLSINQVFENHKEDIKKDINWIPITTTLNKFVTQILSYLGNTSLSDEQEVYMYLVILEDFDAYYDGRYASIIDTWASNIWSNKSYYWQNVFAMAWLQELDSHHDYFRPSKLLLDKLWMERNNIKNTQIVPIKSITFID